MRIDGRTVLLTGGAGFIGSNLADALLDRGCRVRVLDDLSTGRRENLAEAIERGAELVVGDVGDEATARAAADGVEVVLHLAVGNLRESLRDPWSSHDRNAGATLALCEAVRDLPLARFVYCSSSEVYGTAQTAPMDEEHPTRPTTVYGASKLAGEWYALAYRETHGLPVTVVRPFNTYGPREHVLGTSGEVIPKMTLRALAGRPPVVFGDGEQTRDFTHVGDTVAGIIAVTEADAALGRAINVAYGREVSVNRVAELVCAAAGTGVAPVRGPGRPADVRRHFADVTVAREQLGWRAEVPIEEGIARYVTWFAERHGHELDAMLAAEQERNWEPQSA